MIETNPQLVPGSVWQRVRKDKTTFTTVLFVSNQGLSDAVLEQFPPQVVFLTDKLNVLTQDVGTFLASRTFHTIDMGTENLIQALLSPPEEDLDDTDPTETIDKIVVDDLEEHPGGGVVVADDSESDIPVFTPEFFNGANLDAAFLSYTEAPFSTGDTLHVLRFALSQSLSLDQLKAAFDLSSPIPAIEKFTVDCNQEHPTVVEPNGFIQVFLEVTNDGNGVGVVYVTSLGDFRGQPPVSEGQPVEFTPQQSEQLVTIPQVQVSAAVQQVTFS